MSMLISNQLLDIAEEHATVEELVKMIEVCESELEDTLIKIKTLGKLLFAAHESESESMSKLDDKISSFLIKNYGEEAQEYNLLISNLKYYLKHKQRGTIPENRRLRS